MFNNSKACIFDNIAGNCKTIFSYHRIVKNAGLIRATWGHPLNTRNRSAVKVLSFPVTKEKLYINSKKKEWGSVSKQNITGNRMKY